MATRETNATPTAAPSSRLDAAEEFAGGIFLEAGRVLVDDVAEDQRIEQREDLVDGRQDERQRDQRSVLPEVGVEDLHLSGHYSMPIAPGIDQSGRSGRARPSREP